ncbi:MAG: macro domain-containing protein [Lactobacillus equicursoris]|nr:macro domain-containing protein [Lactobacillus equicursoris]MDD6407926.1 macro domain-containing protein [Lactobacillus equicursoris]
MSPAQTLVNTVNTEGVMGKGIAKEFKKYYPQMFEKYRDLCQKNNFTTGQLYLSKEEPELKRKKPTGNYRKRWILDFPTKKKWRNKSKIDYIEAGLDKFVNSYKEKGIESISFPMLGVGNGGLEWEKVKEVMEYYLNPINDIPIYVHIYNKNKSFDNYNRTEISGNLNTAHNDWKKNVFLQSVIENEVKNKTINSDGIVKPRSELYHRGIDLREEFENVKFLPVINEELPELLWIQKDSRHSEGNNYTQLSLFS